MTTSVMNASARVWIGAVALLASAAPVLAQAEQLLPPENKDGIKGMTWRAGCVTVLLLVLVVVAAFLKTKRGHQD